MLGQIGLGFDGELALAYLIVWGTPLAVFVFIGTFWLVRAARRRRGRIEMFAFGSYWFVFFSVCRATYRFLFAQ